MTTYASFLVSNLTLTPSLYSSTITLRVPLTATTAFLSTTPGTSLIDGTTSKITTGYITVCSNAEDSRFWNIQDTFPYSGYADLERLTASSLGIRSTLYLGRHVDISGYVSTFKTMFTSEDYTHRGKIIPTIDLLASTITGMASFGYISSGPYAVASTMEGLGSVSTATTYISSGGLASTVDGLGTLFVSYASLTSSISGNTTFIRTSNLASTLDHLGSLYMSTPAIQSTIGGISTLYTPFSSNISTVSTLISMELSSFVSTVRKLGTFYISSPAIQSTVNGLGKFYVSSAQVNAYLSSADYTFSRDLLSTMHTKLGSGTNGYMSTPQLFSSVTGIQRYTPQPLASNVRSLGYISTLDLLSTIPGLSPLFVSSLSLTSTVETIQLKGGFVLTSTFNGLGTANYISIPSVISTTTALSNAYSSTLTSFYMRMGLSYMSTGQIVSTVEGLGSPAFISTASLTSSSLGYINYVLLNIVNLSGNSYVSTSGFVSTTKGLIDGFSNNIMSTVNGLGSTYMSTGHITSTVAGLGSASYISIASLLSTIGNYVNYEDVNIQAMVNTPSNYVSTSSLVSTTTGLTTSFSNQLISTVNGLGSVTGAQLFSTVRGLGTPTYISIPSLISSAIYYANYESLELQKFVRTAGQNYISTSGLVTFTTGFLNEYIGSFLSTLYGLKEVSYISTPLLVSTVNGLASPTYISAPNLVSSTFGYSNIGERQLVEMINNIGQTYISRGGLESTTVGLISHYSNSLVSTVDGLGSSSYISIPDLVNAVIQLQTPPIPYSTYFDNLISLTNANTAQLTGQISNNSNMIEATYSPASSLISTTSGYLAAFSNGLTSTAIGLGTAGYISFAHLVSTVNGLGTSSYISIPSLVSTTDGLLADQLAKLQGFVSTPQVYISTQTLVSTTTGLLSNFSVQLISTTIGLGMTYISLPQHVSTVEGIGRQNVSTTSMVSTINFLTTSYIFSSITLFENTLGTNYISTQGIISTVTGLSITYTTASTLQSTVSGLGTLYISTASMESTIAGIALQQGNITGLLTSTVAGLGKIYFSSLTQPLAESPDLVNAVSYFAGGYIDTLAATPNGYLYSGGSLNLATANFYEGSNLTYSGLDITATNYISADIVRTIDFGSASGGGTGLTITSDSNLKEDIVGLSPSQSLDQVMLMRGVYYKMIGDSTPYIGCIAQEVEEVFPEVITSHVIGENHLKSMKYEFLLAPLVESVKELTHIHSTVKYFVQKNQENIQ